MNFDLYSERLRQQASGGQDVFQFDEIPKKVRVQITQIALAAIGPSHSGEPPNVLRRSRGNLPSYEFWYPIRQVLTREYGLHSLANNADPMDDVLSHFQLQADLLSCLDVIELIARTIDINVRRVSPQAHEYYGITQSPDDAIAEINLRLRRAGCGYQVERGEVVRVDSQFTHATIVKPVLSLLGNPLLAGADTEFRSAHSHYRNDEYEAALVDACKSLESTLKAICAAKGWAVAANATAKALIDTVVQNKLLPQGVLDHVSAIRATLEQGVPYLRNNFAGHGQGTTSRQVPQELCAYGLHLAGASILMLANAAGLR